MSPKLTELMAEWDATTNGVSHAKLTQRAHAILRADMASYGNTLSEAHDGALLEILASYTRFAQGTLKGRFAYPLDTGLGKTLSVVAWLAALHETGADHVSTLIAASKVEALCALKWKLMAHGVPEGRIGLAHSYNFERGEASLPATKHNHTKPILLVTHQRVRGGQELDHFEQYNSYQGSPRTFAIWDEALLVSDARAVSARYMRAELEWLRVMKGEDELYRKLIEKFDIAENLIADEATRQREQKGRAPVSVRLAPLSLGVVEEFKAALKWHPRLAPLGDFLSMWHEPLRVVPTGDGDSVISYRLVVPRELSNVAVLDASYTIRRLEQLGGNVKEGMTWHKRLKDYRNVQVRQVCAAGGREAVTKDFRSKAKKYAGEVVEFVKATPGDEGVIVFTFKSDQRADFAETLQGALRDAGVDPEATLENGKPRFIWRTWGQHEGDSDYSYARNVVLCGVLHRSRVELAGAMVGELDDLEAEVTGEDIAEIVRSEVAHCVYQALSRGSCRIVRNGLAAPMRALVIHRGKRLRNDLADLMPGVVWAYDSEQPKVKRAAPKSDSAADRIAAYLQGVAPEVRSVSIRALKDTLGNLGVSVNAFTRAAHKAAGLAAWVPVGRSLVRTGAG